MVPPARRPPLTAGSRRHAGEAGRSREGCRRAGRSQAGRGAGSRLARPRSSGPPLLLATAPPRAPPLPPPLLSASPLPSTSETRAAPPVTAFLSFRTLPSHTPLAPLLVASAACRDASASSVPRPSTTSLKSTPTSCSPSSRRALPPAAHRDPPRARQPRAAHCPSHRHPLPPSAPSAPSARPRPRARHGSPQPPFRSRPPLAVGQVHDGDLPCRQRLGRVRPEPNLPHPPTPPILPPSHSRLTLPPSHRLPHTASLLCDAWLTGMTSPPPPHA